MTFPRQLQGRPHHDRAGPTVSTEGARHQDGSQEHLAAVRSARLVRFGLTKSEEPQTTRHGTGRGKGGADEQGQGGAATDAAWPRACQREDQADQGRTQGLPDEPRAGENTAGTAGTFGRRAGKNGAVVRGLEEAEPDAADRHAPSDPRHPRVRFLPFQPAEVLSESLSSGTVHVVGLARGLAGLVVPSRLYGVLAAGRPVIAAAEDESETAKLVRPDDSDEIKEALAQIDA